MSERKSRVVWRPDEFRTVGELMLKEWGKTPTLTNIRCFERAQQAAGLPENRKRPVATNTAKSVIQYMENAPSPDPRPAAKAQSSDKVIEDDAAVVDPSSEFPSKEAMRKALVNDIGTANDEELYEFLNRELDEHHRERIFNAFSTDDIIKFLARAAIRGAIL